MATYDINSQFTLLERAKRSADGKRILPILDVLDKFGVDEFVKDVPFYAANQGLKHRVVRLTSRTTSTRRNFYQGVNATQETTQVIHEPVILFEQRSEIDEDEMDTVENPNELRRQRDENKIKSILEDFVHAMFNDARTSGSEYINGLAQRMGTLSYPGHTTSTLPYVWDNGGSAGTGSLCSLWIVEWGPQACHGLYPSGTAVRGAFNGIIARNKGRERTSDRDDAWAIYYAYTSQFKFWFGLAVNNDYKIARIANIHRDKNNVNSIDENVIIEALAHGKFNIPATRIYVNPYLQAQINIKAKDKNNVDWTVEEVFGRNIPAFWGIPVRKLDDTILSATESAIA